MILVYEIVESKEIMSRSEQMKEIRANGELLSKSNSKVDLP